MDTQKVWFVTGASKGLGLSLVKKLINEGYKVAATSRKLEDLTREMGEASDVFLPLQVDLVNEQSVANAIAETVAKWGTIVGDLLCYQVCRRRFYRIACGRSKGVWHKCNSGVSRLFSHQFFVERIAQYTHK